MALGVFETFQYRLWCDFPYFKKGGSTPEFGGDAVDGVPDFLATDDFDLFV